MISDQLKVIPKKIKLALQTLGITGVCGGYVTMEEKWDIPKQAVFTGWDDNGNPIVLLVKKPNCDWTLHNRDSRFR